MALRGENFRFWLPVGILGICLVGLAVRLTMLHLGYVQIEKEPERVPEPAPEIIPEMPPDIPPEMPPEMETDS